MKVALVTAIESNKQCINDINGITFEHQRLYEDEAILCFEAWRKNGGWLKDMAIYAYCPSKNVISEKTKAKLKDLNVTYIEKYHPEVENFQSGYINAPFCGYILEQELSEDILIHIDLDMKLIQPLPKSMIEGVYNEKYILCGQYDDVSKKDQRLVVEEWENPVDTGFLISRRDSGFYEYYYKELMKLYETKGDDRWKKNCQDVPEHFLEEYVIDVALNEKRLPIKGIQKYQVGEGYASINHYSDEEIDSIYFWHEHIHHSSYYNKVREKIDFFKRTKGKFDCN
ncbi:hypothetical protein HBN50_14730 [Halobacteriovorax sp. GB3]|uniref:hypothetical protein n=1 Tax=Halobacteriovorax sp. GB3 TaxID=2719615 RepID=UPI00235F904B|nr:hypothetical protein [Halobacteriovorax sp. GB3]MDD0854365.1 hypothetical protein [Halobacteriovorax sp. GB3]